MKKNKTKKKTEKWFDCTNEFSERCIAAHLALLGAILMSYGVRGKRKERIKEYVYHLIENYMNREIK